jgi:hypothetical protein
MYCLFQIIRCARASREHFVFERNPPKKISLMFKAGENVLNVSKFTMNITSLRVYNIFLSNIITILRVLLICKYLQHY